MKNLRHILARTLTLLCGSALLLGSPHSTLAQPTPGATVAFNSYASAVESRLAEQHRSSGGFLLHPGGQATEVDERLHRGELVLERVSTPPAIDGALLHHWRGTAFAPGAHAADFERLLRDFDAYPRTFAPQVVQARVLSQTGEQMTASMRVRQQHVITVVMDTAYDIDFGRLDRQHGYSLSRSTRIAEIANAGLPSEHALGASEEHGFLWRLNTYWSYEERDGGLYLQIESVSLTRDIPRGLGWVIRPYVESIPRESLEFTLRAACNAIRK